MNTKNFLIAFDFDGVIWNSAEECFHIGYKAYRKLSEPLKEDENFLKEKFLQGRFLVKVAGDFFIIFHLLKENLQIDFSDVSFEEFYSLRDSLNNKASEFAVEFYRERDLLQKESFSFWLSLQGPYPGVIEQLAVIHENFLDLVICSNKDGKSIKRLLKVYGQFYQIYSREYSTYKPDLLLKLAGERNISPGNIILIDDLMENLLPVKEAGIKVMMADWGYNNKNERKRALQNNIPLICKNDILGQLMAYAT